MSNKRILTFTRQEGKDDWKSIPKEGYDLIVFTGGYFVADKMSNEDLMKSAHDIINFKINNNNVILLLNQDDLQYINENQILGSYRHEIAEQCKNLLKRKKHLFSFYDVLPGHLDISFKKWPQMGYFYPRGYFINDAFYEFEPPVKFIHPPNKPLTYNLVDNYKVGIFIPYMDNVDPKLVAAQKKVFDVFNVNVNQILWRGLGGNPHSDFVNHFIDNADCDFYVLFDIDSIPLRPDFLEILVKRAGKTKIVGAEQTTDMISDEPFAAPSCFIISKDLYNQMGRPSFNPTYRSDDTQELTHLAWEQGIEVDFIRFSHCKIPNYYWKFKDGRQYGFGSYYEDLAYHNFQARWDKFTQFFYEECENIVKKYS